MGNPTCIITDRYSFSATSGIVHVADEAREICMWEEEVGLREGDVRIPDLGGKIGAFHYLRIRVYPCSKVSKKSSHRVGGVRLGKKGE